MARAASATYHKYAYADVLRVLAIALVVFDHVWIAARHDAGDAFRFDWLGVWGVNAFFVLSAFLLTGPFLRPLLAADAPFPAVSAFFARRALGILPLYVVAVGFSVALESMSGAVPAPKDVLAHLFLLQNVSPVTVQSINGPLWTMPVTVAFYLLLPVVAWGLVRAFRGRSEAWRLRGTLVALALIIIAGLALRFAAIRFGGVHIYDRNWSFVALRNVIGMAPSFAVGVILAVVQRRRAARTAVPSLPRSLGVLAIAALLALASKTLLMATWSPHPLVPFVLFDAISAASVGCVLYVISEPWPIVARIGGNAVVRWVAAVAYAVYLFHQPIVNRAGRFGEHAGAKVAVVILVTLAVAALAHHLIERPIARLKDRVGGPIPVPSAIGVSIGVIFACAVAFVIESERLRAAWPPSGWPFAVDLPFVMPRIEDPHAAWTIVTAIALVWSAACIVCVKAFLARGAQTAFPTLIMACQIGVLVVTSCASMPFNSDQYAYVGYGELTQLGDSPYAPPPKTARLTPQLHAISTVWGISASDGSQAAQPNIIVRSRYGPLFTMLCAAVLAPFAHASVETQARALRALAALAAVLCSLLLWLLVRTRSWGTAAVAAFALNPAIAQQTALGAHNDIFALVFVLLAAVLAARKRVALAALAFAASIAIKLTYAPLFPAFLAFVYVRRGGRAALASAAIAGASLVALALPFGLRASLLQPAVDVGRYNAPFLAHLAMRVLRHVPQLRALDEHAVGAGYNLLIVAAGLALAVAVARRRRVAEIAAGLIVLIFAGAHFEPWYAIMLVPLLALPAMWSLALFLGLTLASQIFQGAELVGSYDNIPVVPFLALSAVGVPLLAAFFSGWRPPVLGYRVRSSEALAGDA
jgi:peptidoglycan/LPS O-acetylase OafA/YrhL